MAEARKHRAKLLPVDSEHNAVFQCIAGHRRPACAASCSPRAAAHFATGRTKGSPCHPADALKHPNWVDGPQDHRRLATLANKGLELIEAQWLFGLHPAQCTAVVHPQSIVHCLVEFNDGAMLAQLCPPSMTFPIQHALLHPNRAPGVDAPLDFTRLLSLEFRPIDEAVFPMMRLARETMLAGGVAPAVYNAANELAVGAFLTGRIPFLAIPRVVEQTLGRLDNFEPVNLPAVLDADAGAAVLLPREISG